MDGSAYSNMSLGWLFSRTWLITFAVVAILAGWKMIDIGLFIGRHMSVHFS